ncbi:hypothetical protein BN128_3372 [Cronobacter sakazakii 696]|nr:hypothetical protein BN129_3387 [Cronobacter sakazakii 701]CCK09254.1 hypothetical protein BN128_3372 [Cronobacter sakazakii 696]
MCAFRGAVDNLHLARPDIDALNGFAGKRRAGRAHVKRQPLAVGRPDVNIGELMVTRGEGELFHQEKTLKPKRASG